MVESNEVNRSADMDATGDMTGTDGQTRRAEVAFSYLARLGLFTVVGIGFGLWCMRDGLFVYPEQREAALAYEELKPENSNRLDEWDAIAEENGWPADDPGDPKSDADIKMQFFMAAITGPPGVLCLLFLLWTRGRWIEADEEGLRTSWGAHCRFDEIDRLNKKLWKNKGIAKVYYKQDGTEGKIVLDDCKYDRYVTEWMLKLVESKIDVEQIVGGPPQQIVEERDDDAEANDDDANNRGANDAEADRRGESEEPAAPRDEESEA